MHAPQPAVIAANHGSDLDTPLILGALPRSWRSRTLVGAAADRFYRHRAFAVMTGLWINTFPFDRSGEGAGSPRRPRSCATATTCCSTRRARAPRALEGFRAGVARLCVATGAPLVPVHVAAPRCSCRRTAGSPSAGKTTVTFGAPLLPRDGEEVEEFLARSQEAADELATP